MMNPIEAVLCSVLPAPRQRAAVLAIARRLPKCRMQRNMTMYPYYISFASSAEHPASPPFKMGTRAMAPSSASKVGASYSYVEKLTAGGTTLPLNKEREDRIRKHLKKANPGYIPSSYDTAWVAMVPLPGSNPEAPSFPQCVEWIRQNQHHNGSWGLNKFDLSVSKETLLSTLACVVALKKWNVGSEQIKKGMQFIAINFSVIMNEEIDAPVGFNLTLPALVSLAIRLGLDFPAMQNSIDQILRLRVMELKRLAGEKRLWRGAYLAYIAEGLESLPELNEVFKFQMRNGSLFNSPAATAAAFIQNYDDNAFRYLDYIVKTFGGAVPTVYPQNVYSQLSMVDTLDRVGISRHFTSEIKSILDKTLWSHRDEEVMSDVATCAMALRLLRMNGYNVSSEELSHVAEASTFHNSLEGCMDDTKALLELYKASEVSLSENDPMLEKIYSWSRRLLNDKLCSDATQRMPLFGEVQNTLKFPFYAMVESIDRKRHIECFDAIVSPKLKLKCLPDVINLDILALAVQDFSLSQSTYQDEFLQLESWEKENKLDQLQFTRKNLTNSYITSVMTICPHELSGARIACAKTIALAVVADDFFDVGGSKEEQENLISLVERWDQHHEVQFYSDHVEVVFSAIYSTVNQLGAVASVGQNRDVTKYMVESWRDFIRALAADAERHRCKYMPTLEDYMKTATVSVAVGLVGFTTLYFLEQCLWEDIIKDPEYKEMYRLMSTCARLLNDCQSFERECKDGQVNSVSLVLLESGGSTSVEAAKTAIRECVASHRTDLLRLVLREDSVVPKVCREMFWKLYKTTHILYDKGDGYSSPKEMMGAINAVINEPLKLEHTVQRSI